VITVQAQAQTLTSALPGRTSAFMSADIRPQVNGIVQKRLFTEGATVKAGQALYQIDAAPYQATEAAAKAALAKAQAQARTAEVNAKRNAELVRIDAISRQAYDESLATAQQTAADVAVAQAALATARINLGYTRIAAPISGRTALSNVNAGGLVTANQTGVLTTISQLDPMYVDVTQSSSELLQLKRDLAAGRFEKLGEGTVRITILLEDGSTYAHPGRLQFAGVTVNPSTGAITLRAVVPNPDGVLMPGMYVQTLLPTGVSSEALLVPQQAVTRDIAGKANVLVLGPENKVARRAIEIDRAVGSRWLVSSGLAAGDTVVVDGFQRIKPGDTVAPQPMQLPGGGTRASAPPAMPPGAGEAPKATAAVPAPSASNPAR
jgi:membrane fusion protein (multidrug efflux system)